MTTCTARMVALVDDDANLSIAIANPLRSARIDVATLRSKGNNQDNTRTESCSGPLRS